MAALPEQEVGGEASLKLPDLSQVQFLGVNGHKLEVITYDTEGNGTKAVQQLRRLIESDKIDVVFGPSSSGEALQTIEIFAAGAALQELLLALEQEPPDGVLILAIAGPVLLDRMIPQPAAHRVLRKVLPLHLGTPGRRFNRADGPIRTVCRVTRDT